MTKKTNFTEEELKIALNKAITKLYTEKLIYKSDSEKIILQKLILGLVGDVITNLGFDYKDGGTQKN